MKRLGVVCPVLLLALSLTGCSTSGSAPETTTATLTSSVAATSNPQVAAYTLTLPRAGTVTIDFGKDATYGLETAAQSFAATTPGTMYVTGMLANTSYHMKATVAYADRTSASDADHTFTTGAIPAGLIPTVAVTQTNGLTPQPGVELVDTLLGTTPSIPFVTDLSGNVIWSYLFPDRQSGSLLYPLKLQTNGHFLCLIAPESQLPATAGPTSATTLNVLREFDLAGNTIRQLTMADLNTSLAAANFNLTLQLFSHDFAVLPNGHILVIANTLKAFTNLTGYPGTTNVLGDVVIDLDQNFKPVWVWNEFDHLDVNRQPMGFPDWTHTNAIAYSPDDGNFLVSIRHQNWIVKVDYNNGAGAGDILWKLGEGGDFKLEGAVDPTDWFYAQHDVNFVSANSTGSFQVAIMDNGNDRMFPAGVQCGTAGQPGCTYSAADVMQVNETAKTASYVFRQIMPNIYSGFAGNTRVLGNSNVEYDMAGVGTDSFIYEVTPTATPQTVWTMHVENENTYRVFRMPSLYPGVQW